jgi:hypothetical protein
MIVVGVGDEDQVDGGQIADVERGSEQATRAAGPQAQANANTVGENGIGQDIHFADAQEDGGVADPGGGEILLVPGLEIGFWGRGGTMQAVEEAELSASTAEPVRYAQSERLSLSPISNHAPLQMPELPDFPWNIICEEPRSSIERATLEKTEE